jgi:hypothetical protein
VINTVDHDSNSDSNPLLTDLEDCDVIKKDEATRRDKGRHRVSEKDGGARLMTHRRTCRRR